MRCPSLSVLPTPPSGKTGWPWTKESQQLPETMPDGKHWPKISIVTPSYNQGGFIEETIRSVLLQGYPNLEYIIIDGGSMDQSVEIIKKYEKWLTYWVSEKDNGQASAINKGLHLSTGELVAWINSDDLYVPSALSNAAKYLGAGTVDHIWLCGACQYFDETGYVAVYYPVVPALQEWMLRFDCPRDYSFPQPSVFWNRVVFEKIGFLNEGYHYSFDHDYWLRIRLAGQEPLSIRDVVSNFRLHEQSKTVSAGNRFIPDDLEIAIKLSRMQPFLQRLNVVYRVKKFIAEKSLWPDSSVRETQSLKRLLRLLHEHPVLFFSRPYWGAVRRMVQ